MSYSTANITIVGRVGKNPERRSPQAPVEFSVAVDQGFGDKKETVWFAVKCWGKLGDIALEAVAKGDCVTAIGRFEIRKYTTAAGAAGVAYEVNAAEVVFASKPRAQDNSDITF